MNMDTAYEALSGLGQALAHPTRVRILDLLARGEQCVCHLTALLGLPQPHVSQHLRVLRDSGLVTDRRDAQMVFYRLSDARAAAALSLLKDLSRSLDSRVVFPEPPTTPIEGCPCPLCSAAAGAVAGASCC
jgi:ArsR family transcriptional regulator